MKIRVMSDLHLEFGDLEKFQANKTEVLILAGDIHVGKKALPFIADLCLRFREVIYVLGNHEFYNEDIGIIIEFWSSIKIPNFHFLENSSVVIDGIKFIGSTLWTSYKNADYFVMYAAKQQMNDYKKIRYNGYKNKISPQIINSIHNKSVDYIIKELKEDIPCVIITHHCPLIELINIERWGVSDLNWAYASDLKYIIEQYKNILAWVFGHTHESINETILGTKFICNPRGYHEHEINPNFRPDKSFLIGN